MAQKKAPKKNQPPPRRISPLKPGLSGARNWATAQVRSASYSRQHRMRLMATGTILLMVVFWGALWLGGYIPAIKASGAQFTKQRLMNMGFVVKHVDVVGEGRISEAQVRAVLGVQPGDYLFDMDIKNAQTRVQNLTWIDTAVVRRLWPDRIVVHVNERRPYALWQENGIIKVVDRSGVVIADAHVAEFSALPFVVGVGAAEHAGAFLDILAVHTELQNRTEAIVYVSQRRWDVVLKDQGARILLPANDPHTALKNLEKYDREYGILGLDLDRIDMRVKGRLTLRPTSIDRDKRA
ncbi:MAG: hypothetical protein COA69_08825 [Robiginitomaculum sp.]|nr:MAG: hypothetical protein COA69_08825 [Robiginitomaculum sp.]